MVQVITKRGLKGRVGDEIGLVRWGNRALWGKLGYDGDLAIGDGFLVPVGTGKFFVNCDVYSPREKGYVGTRRFYLRGGETVAFQVTSASDPASSIERRYKTKL